MTSKNKPNIVIIVLDTVRFDTFNKVYKKMKIDFDKIGRFESIDKCIAPASWTLPSHVSLFTGMYPSEHGSHFTKTIGMFNIEEIKLKKKTFLEDIKKKNYKTYGISANPLISPLYGFTNFDKFKDESYFIDIRIKTLKVPKNLKLLIAKYVKEYDGNFFKIGIAMLKDNPSNIKEIIYLPLFIILTIKNLIKKYKAIILKGFPIEKGGINSIKTFKSFNVKEPFFFFINFMEAHEPYSIKKGMDFGGLNNFLKKTPSKKLINLWKRKYVYATEKVLDYAYNLSKYILENHNNTIIIITSDHGQEFGEHNGFMGHRVRLDDELIHVPFIIHLPKGFDYIKSNQYSSLVNVREFINSILKGDRKSIEKLYSKNVYAESFEQNIEYPNNRKNEIDFKKLRMTKKYHKRTFKQ